jgi:hypothetical protein
MDYVAKHQELTIERMKMDRFFTMFLDKFEKKMDPDKPNTPIWKLYKKETARYNKLCQEIRNTEYWIKKNV